MTHALDSATGSIINTTGADSNTSDAQKAVSEPICTESAPLPGLDEAQMAEGIRQFLTGMGLSLDHPDLKDTPARVVQAWQAEFLAGYGMDPTRLLAVYFPSPGGGPVILTGLSFVSMCPHHLLPVSGVAHVAYLPGDEVVGLGRISSLVDCFTRRLVLQETSTRQIAETLMAELGCAGAACVLSARQGCLSLRGARQTHANCTTAVYLGAFEQDESLRTLFVRAWG